MVTSTAMSSKLMDQIALRTVLAMFGLTSCYTAVDQRDVVTWGPYDEERLGLAPAVVVGEVLSLDRSRRIWVRPYANQEGFRAREWVCEIRVVTVLRGDVNGKMLTVKGYVGDAEMSVGISAQICGNPGTLAIYFLRWDKNGWRSIADDNRTFYSLHPQTPPPESAAPFSEAVWNLAWNSGELYGDPVETIDAQVPAVSTLIGPMQFLMHCRRRMEREAAPEQRARLCLLINRKYPGFGFRECIVQVLSDSPSTLPAHLITELREAMDQTEATRLLGWTIADPHWRYLERYLGGYKVPPRQEEIEDMLLLLSRHPEPSVRLAARRRLESLHR